MKSLESISKNSNKIISRFDEVLLDKASKFSLDELKKEITSKFMQISKYDEHVTQINEKDTNFNKQINNLHHLIETGHDTLYERIKQSYDRYAAITK